MKLTIFSDYNSYSSGALLVSDIQSNLHSLTSHYVTLPFTFASSLPLKLHVLRFQLSDAPLNCNEVNVQPKDNKIAAHELSPIISE
jgi:hypothetical protein